MSDSVDCTPFGGNLSRKVTDNLLYELFLQAGPLMKVHIPEDRATGEKKNFAYVEFKHPKSVPFSIELMKGITLFGQTLHLQICSGSSHGTPFPEEPPQMSAPHQQLGQDVAGLRQSQAWSKGNYNHHQGTSPRLFRNGPGHGMPQMPQRGMPPRQAALQGLQVAAMPRMDPSMDPSRRLTIVAQHQRNALCSYNHPGNYGCGRGNRYHQHQGHCRHRPY